MLRILLAEDEKLERDALKFIIQKNMTAALEIAEAENGRSAIAAVRTFKPDIVLLDIKMPGINGIEAAWKIRSIDPQIKIIFITAYNQFEYAQEAIQIGVTDFIVKPASEERIMELLSRLVSSLSQEKQELMQKEDAWLRLDKFSNYLETEFIYNIAVRGMPDDKFTAYLSILDMDFHAGRGGVLRIHYDSYPLSVQNAFQKDILKNRSIAILKKKLLNEKIHCLVNVEFSSPFILFYSANDQPFLSHKGKFAELLLSAAAEIKTTLSLIVDIGFGQLFSTPDKAPASFFGARNSLISMAEMAADAATDADAGTEADANADADANPANHQADHARTLAIPLEYEIDIEQAVIQGERAKAKEIFQSIQLWMQNSTFSFPVRKKLLVGLAAVLQHAAIAQLPDRAQQPVSNDLFDIAAEEDLFTSFSLLLNELLDGVISSQQMENSSAIHTAKEYIAENFRRDISLNEIAAHCSLSNCYFSKLFKQHMEVNVIEYITYMRIRESKKLLIDTDLSIKEIGSAIGYSDANYFARVFRRVEQLSPRAYRNKKIQKQQNNADTSESHSKTAGNTQ